MHESCASGTRASAYIGGGIPVVEVVAHMQERRGTVGARVLRELLLENSRHLERRV